MPQGVKILAIRHGETDWNTSERLQGQTDIELNANGVHQAQLLAKSLAGYELDAIYSSDLQRASKTARILADSVSQDILVCQGLRERHFGCFQGLTFKQVEERAPDEALRWRQRDPDFVPGGDAGEGESLAVFSERVLKAVNDIAQQHLGQSIAIVTHGGVLDVILRIAAGLDAQAKRTWTLGNTSVSQLLWRADARLEVLEWPHTHHLEAGNHAVEPNAEF